jgi:formylmethanofuran dehydrogenase subunit E
MKSRTTMDKTAILRSIHNDQIQYIQQKVRVDYDNRRQQPVSFIHAGREHAILSVVARFKLTDDRPHRSYLLEDSDHAVYFLYYQLEGFLNRAPVGAGFWVLGYRILQDHELMQWFREERNMLANISLKRVIDFHGHICPELAIGGKFCEFVQNQVKKGGIPETGLTVVSENTTSALDAIQVLLGTTIGNQRLLVLDYGKHSYSLFCKDHDHGWKLRMKPQIYGDEVKYNAIEEKILQEQATLEDLLNFQRLLDTRIQRLIMLTPEELFSIEEIDGGSRPEEISGTYRICTLCGEQVLASRSIENGGSIYCLPCFQQTHPGCQMHGMH